jgi:chromatin modification-related protein VID21
VCLSLSNLVYITPQSKHRGSIANLDEWLQHLPPPFDEESEEEEIQEVPQQPEILEILEDVEPSEVEAPDVEVLDVEESDVEESDVEEPDVEGPDTKEPDIGEPDFEELDVEGSDAEGPDVGDHTPYASPSVEVVQPLPISVLSDIEDSEHQTETPPREPEPHQEMSPRSLTPTEIVPAPPIPVMEEARSPSRVFYPRSFPPNPFNSFSAPVSPTFEEEQDAHVDVVIISDEEEVQSLDSHIDNLPRTPSPTIPISIDTALLHRSPDRPMIVAPPSPAHDPQYNFDAEFSFDPVKPPAKNDLPYNLPLLNSLPPEFRKKTTRIQRKREKEKERERERNEIRKEKEEWAPMGMARWRALLRANPTWQHLARSTKSLTTKDWNVRLRRIFCLCKFSTSIRLP